MLNENQFYLERSGETLYFWYGDAANYYKAIVYGFIVPDENSYLVSLGHRLLDGTSLVTSADNKSEAAALKWGIAQLKESLSLINNTLEFDHTKYVSTLVEKKEKKEKNAKLKTDKHEKKTQKKSSKKKVKSKASARRP